MDRQKIEQDTIRYMDDIKRMNQKILAPRATKTPKNGGY